MAAPTQASDSVAERAVGSESKESEKHQTTLPSATKPVKCSSLQPLWYAVSSRWQPTAFVSPVFCGRKWDADAVRALDSTDTVLAVYVKIKTTGEERPQTRGTASL